MGKVTENVDHMDGTQKIEMGRRWRHDLSEIFGYGEMFRLYSMTLYSPEFFINDVDLLNQLYTQDEIAIQALNRKKIELHDKTLSEILSTATSLQREINDLIKSSDPVDQNDFGIWKRMPMPTDRMNAISCRIPNMKIRRYELNEEFRVCDDNLIVAKKQYSEMAIVQLIIEIDLIRINALWDPNKMDEYEIAKKRFIQQRGRQYFGIVKREEIAETIENVLLRQQELVAAYKCMQQMLNKIRVQRLEWLNFFMGRCNEIGSQPQALPKMKLKHRIAHRISNLYSNVRSMIGLN